MATRQLNGKLKSVDEVANLICQPPDRAFSANVRGHFRHFQRARLKSIETLLLSESKELGSRVSKLLTLFGASEAGWLLQLPQVAGALARIETSLANKHRHGLENEIERFEGLAALCRLSAGIVDERFYEIPVGAEGLLFIGANSILYPCADAVKVRAGPHGLEMVLGESSTLLLQISETGLITIRNEAYREKVEILDTVAIDRLTIQLFKRSPFSPRDLQNPHVEFYRDLEQPTINNLMSGILMLQEFAPEYLSDLEIFTKYIVPLDWPERGDAYVGASSSYHFGVLIASPYDQSIPDASLKTAEILVHENCHTKFTALSDPWGGIRHPIVEQPWVRIPWKASDRPLIAAIDGFFVHAVVLAFYKAIAPKIDSDFVTFRIDHLRDLLSGAIGPIRQHEACLTEQNRLLWDGSLSAAQVLGARI